MYSARNAESSRKKETLDKKLEHLEAKEEAINAKTKKSTKDSRKRKPSKKAKFEMLERISGFSIDQAKDYLLKKLEDELVHEKAIKIMEIEQQTKDDADNKAREIISLAIQRCAADHVAEATISVVPLPNDE